MFDGSLPLHDPNLQTNNFNANTGDFGDGEPNEAVSAGQVVCPFALLREVNAEHPLDMLRSR